MGQRFLLTGGAGFIGSYITRELLAAGDEVILYDAFINYVSSFENTYSVYMRERFRDIQDRVTMVRGNVTHKEYLRKALLDYKPDVVIHLAALPSADVSNVFSEEAMDNNLVATVNCLEVLRSVDFVKRFVYTSSSMIYGDFKTMPVNEDHPKSPKDIYGATKYAGEIMVETYGRRFGLEYTIIRPSAVYGPTDVNRRVTGLYVENAFRGKPLVLDNGGTSKLDFTYVEDTAHGFVLAAKSPAAKNQIFNITRGEGRTIRELGELVAKHVPGTELVEKPAKVFRPERGALDISKARTMLGYEPRYSLEEGIAKYTAYVRDLKLFAR